MIRTDTLSTRTSDSSHGFMYHASKRMVLSRLASNVVKVNLPFHIIFSDVHELLILDFRATINPEKGVRLDEFQTASITLVS